MSPLLRSTDLNRLRQWVDPLPGIAAYWVEARASPLSSDDRLVTDLVDGIAVRVLDRTLESAAPSTWTVGPPAQPGTGGKYEIGRPPDRPQADDLRDKVSQSSLATT